MRNGLKAEVVIMGKARFDPAHMLGGARRGHLTRMV
jgi:hypothetical protein